MPSHKNKIIIALAAFLLLLFAVGVYFINSLHEILVAGKQNSLQQLSKRGAAAIHAEMSGSLDALSGFSAQAAFSPEAPDGTRVRLLSEEAGNGAFGFVAYADRSGKGVSSSGGSVSFSGKAYYEKAVAGTAGVVDQSGEVFFSVPVVRDGAVTGALIAGLGQPGRSRLADGIVTGEADLICILRADGSLLAAGASGPREGNLFQSAQPLGRGGDLERMKSDFRGGLPGTGAFAVDGRTMLAAYSGIPGTDGWMLLAAADERRFRAQANRILALGAVLFFVLMSAFSAAGFYFFRLKRTGEEARIRGEEQVRYFTYVDSLTNLPNRKGVKKQFASWAGQCRGDSRNGGALFLDIDSLSSVNKTFGHDAGDKFLCETAARLQRSVGSGDMIGRIGSDEFVILVRGIGTESELESFTKKILKIFQEPYLANGIVIRLTCSIGAMLFRCGETRQKIGFDDVLGRGEFVLNEAKTTRKGSYVLFNDDYGSLIDRRLRLERALKFSIERGELLCYFQPQYDCREKTITGFETLARWKSAEFGMVSPLQFIPMAEKSGFIKELGRFITEETFAFAKSMEGRGLTVSFNVSPMELLQANYAEYIVGRFESYGLSPKSVAIEITESSLIESFEKVVKKLRILNQHGIRIYLDDFGTGFSSLTYLKNLPIDTVKIDKSFIDEIVTKDVEKDIVRMIISLARRLSLEVIAEGVETDDQLRCVSEAGCSLVQGFLISRPVPPDRVPLLLDAAD